MWYYPDEWRYEGIVGWAIRTGMPHRTPIVNETLEVMRDIARTGNMDDYFLDGFVDAAVDAWQLKGSVEEFLEDQGSSMVMEWRDGTVGNERQCKESSVFLDILH